MSPDPAAALRRALTDWDEATATPTAVVTGTVTFTQPGHPPTEIKVGPVQTDRMAHMFNLDTGLITAHRAATQS